MGLRDNETFVRYIFGFWNCFAACYILALGGVLIHFSKILDVFSPPTKSTKELNQIATDWTVVPFVSLRVTNDAICKADETPVFTDNWAGMNPACDCLNGYSFVYGICADY